MFGKRHFKLAGTCAPYLGALVPLRVCYSASVPPKNIYKSCLSSLPQEKVPYQNLCGHLPTFAAALSRSHSLQTASLSSYFFSDTRSVSFIPFLYFSIIFASSSAISRRKHFLHICAIITLII